MILRNPSKHDVCSVLFFLTNTGTAHVWFCIWLFSHLEASASSFRGCFLILPTIGAVAHRGDEPEPTRANRRAPKDRPQPLPGSGGVSSFPPASSLFLPFSLSPSPSLPTPLPVASSDSGVRGGASQTLDPIPWSVPQASGP